jgi:hypothetical protein
VLATISPISQRSVQDGANLRTNLMTNLRGGGEQLDRCLRRREFYRHRLRERKDRVEWDHVKTEHSLMARRTRA